MKEVPHSPTPAERQTSMHRASSRGRWLVLALFILGGLMVGGLFVARALVTPTEPDIVKDSIRR